MTDDGSRMTDDGLAARVQRSESTGRFHSNIRMFVEFAPANYRYPGNSHLVQVGREKALEGVADEHHLRSRRCTCEEARLRRYGQLEKFLR